MSKKLPKHVAQLVEKNNLVAAMKELVAEQNISMSDAKAQIDEYEALLKQQQEKKVQAIAKKQGLSPVENIEPTGAKGLSASAKNNPDPRDSLNQGLNQHLETIGFKKPLIPYWAKRVLIFIIVVVLLTLAFWHLLS